MSKPPERTHHEAFIAAHGAELHQMARDQWDATGRGIIIIGSADHGGHDILYLTEAGHRQNVADGEYEGPEAEIIGRLLAKYHGPDRGFPVAMWHDNQMMTATMVRPVPIRRRGHG
jgi:hypothetical protein